ncbi:hypothetical protein [Thalassotalea aquiviva]|uniref:hypothetical protein n=1 Tax=Thalassotalea aquiviva TaxID=3242415 RepID=UPI00352AAD0D
MIRSMFHIIIAVACCVVGYALYPIVNQPTTEVTIVNSDIGDNAQPQNAHQLASLHENNSEIVHLEDEVIEDLTITEQGDYEDFDNDLFAQDSSLVNDSEQDLDNSIDNNIQLIDPADETQRMIEQGLVKWSQAHKKMINELISAHMSAETGEQMLSLISNNNEFLTQPPLKQDPSNDEYWATNMEQELKFMIDQHELSNDFELLNVKCKQLTCDFFGLDRSGGSWSKIYFSLLINAPLASMPSESNQPKSVVFMENDTTVVYSQIHFKSS